MEIPVQADFLRNNFYINVESNVVLVLLNLILILELDFYNNISSEDQHLWVREKPDRFYGLSVSKVCKAILELKIWGY